MKVLFAVSNEEISESVVKKYQKEYKQIISYKNVYYFNAILKEIQKDKSYDRIVISEDLEAFTNTQYDQIDKFIFEKLDSISDEASNSRGNDIPIILICSDRRTKSEEILVKLFGIGVYNAVIGNDRSIEEVCKLINRPRSKKEAKIYYKIDSEDVNYQAENENDVSEMEIQNILAHYKRLGKNEDRYIDSFNNIAAQYNDTQLRIISKFLPLNVRAVLEERSPKYQQIMSFNNTVSNTLRVKKQEEEGTSETLLVPKNKEKIMSKPVVIPSSVNMKGTRKLAKQKPIENVVEEKTQLQPEANKISEIDDILGEINDGPKDVPEEKEEIIEEVVKTPVKRGRGRPRKNPVPEVKESTTTKRGRGRPRKNPVPEVVEEEATVLPGIEEEEDTETVTLPGVEESPMTLPGIEDEILDKGDVQDSEETFLPGLEEDSTDSEETTVLPGFEEIDDQNVEEENEKSNVEENIEYSDTSRGAEIQDILNNNYHNESIYSPRVTVENNYEATVDLERLLTPDKKIVTFVGTSKNGTSFIVNNLAEQISLSGVDVAILDTTKNRNSYYIYTKNEEDLRNIAERSLRGLVNGVAEGISVNKNLTVYTSLPEETDILNNVGKILETLLTKHTLILIDCDFTTPIGYFKESQETYLVQSLDVLTIQPLTAFLRELKAKNVLDEKKLRIVLNKVVKIRGVNDKAIIGGMAFYNDPSMSFMTELFDRTLIKYVSIPFEEETYIRYLEGIIDCEISLKGYSKYFLQALKELSNMVYQPISSVGGGKKNSYRPPSIEKNNFTPTMNNTLDQMKRNFNQ